MYNENLLLPAPGEIHVWFRELSISGGEFELLSSDERERAGRFHFEKDRNAFIASHAWLRTLLAGYLGADPREIRYVFGEHGKPAIEGAPLQFNLSHSGVMAACAVTGHQAVGIDIERIRPLPDLDQIAGRFFHDAERSELFALPESERTVGFFRCWTRKEAYVKAVGKGLSESAEPPADWSVIDLHAGAGYAAAVAISGRKWVVVPSTAISSGRRR